MKTVLTAFNARYSHSSLAVRYIKEYNREKDIEIAEFSINDNIYRAYSVLLDKKADIYCFSVYIWNIEITAKVAQMLKKAVPEAIIVMGGPECSYYPEKILEKYPFTDYVVMGEGESAVGKLIDALENGTEIKINGVADRKHNGGFAEPVSLESVRFPYTDQSLKELENRIIYFETSRGCPFGCSYCLSSAEKGIRYFPDKYVKNGFDVFFKNRVPLVKLIDRTFNANPQRAEKIIKYIIKNSVCTKVHLEIDPSILTDSLIETLSGAPENLFQLEMGIQSANPETLKAVNRHESLEKAEKNIRKLKSAGNMHIHLDLIAGLPYEDYKSFENSFNYVYNLEPDMLQLGFLKVLHGTSIENRTDIVHADFPPYEVICTKWMSPEEICRLKLIDIAVDGVYNSGAFLRTVKKTAVRNPFKTYEKISEIFSQEKSISRFVLYGKLYEIFGDTVKKELSLDFMQFCQNRAMPEFADISYPNGFKKKCTNMLKSDEFCRKFNVNSVKNLRFEPIGDEIYMMDYSSGILHDITKYYHNV